MSKPLAPLTTRLSFEAGTLLLENLPLLKIPVALLRKVKWDERVEAHRCLAFLYGPLKAALDAAKHKYIDNVAEFTPTEIVLNSAFTPRSHQQEAFDAWLESGCRSVVALPTGAGKTFLAVLAIAHLRQATLVVVPTIDLLQQWAAQLEEFFQQPIGMLGGGSKDIKTITVSTYDSAVIHMEFIGKNFAFLVCDECHHLPGPVNRTAATMSVAPFRLGLTATPELEPEQAAVLHEALGELSCQIHIDQLEGEVLAPYQTKQELVRLDPDEAVSYREKRAIYTNFLKRHHITFRRKDDWGRFLGRCATAPDGREVLAAFMEQKRIARGGRAKLRRVWELIQQHRNEQIIIFTAENDTAYLLGRRFLMPVLTHRTKATERKTILQNFREGAYPVLITSKVLNEGVDVPEASVGIIVSGSGSVREHVQRLGRILRASDDKQAILYELISAETSEENVSKRRREHRAYQRSRKPFGRSRC